jgi:endoglucanase
MDRKPTPFLRTRAVGSGGAPASIEADAAARVAAGAAAPSAASVDTAAETGSAGATPAGTAGTDGTAGSSRQPDMQPPMIDPVDTAGSAGSAAVAPINPFAVTSLYLDPALRPAQSGIEKIASNPVALWIGSWYPDPAAAVRGALDSAGTQLRVLVAYNIYDRGCSGAASGAVGDAAQYSGWIASFAEGIGDDEVVVILEPHALGHDCDAGRLQALADAVAVLKSRPNAHVYIDAGHAGAVDAETMASLLVQAGIADADGFSLNVGDFQTTAASVDYGMAISNAVGSKPFVIDTSRNGRGPAGTEWCNPPDRGLGERPTADTGNERVHAFLWIKCPGESDGECNGGPPAGDWFPSYAEMLAANAVF